MGTFEILCIVIAILIFLYYYSSSKYDFWKNQGVQGPDPVFFFGNIKDMFLHRLSIGDFAKDIYAQFPEETMVGIYSRNTPILIIRDLELIKDVLIKDFKFFASRGLPRDDKVEPLTRNLFFLEPEDGWRPLRKILTPVFTSGKIKDMFYLIVESSNHLTEYLEKIVSVNGIIESRDLSSKFTMNVIGSCAFGVDVNAFSDEDNDFLRNGRKIFNNSFYRLIRRKVRDMTPWLFQLFEPLLKDKELDDFFMNLIVNTMEQRKNQNFVRHDFIDLMRFIKENPDKANNIELTDSLIAAQAFVFFAAGFETSSTTLSHALYELALNPEVQHKLRKRIQEHLEKSDGKLTYDSVNSMKYLHQVFQETLRKYPPGTVHVRKAVEKYTFSGTNVTIPKGTIVWIPDYAIQHDPKYYPKPEVFDPDRFDDEAVKSRHPMLYTPFGVGPRNCIGGRFATFEVNVALIKIIQNYSLHACEKTPIPYVNNPKAYFLAPIGGLFLKFSKIS